MQAHYADTVLTFADSWESLTLAQYEAVVTAPDVYGMLLAVCDKPHLLDMLPDPMAETELTSRLPFLATAPPTFNEWPCPNVLLVNGKALPLPANFDLETFGQMKAAEKLQGPVLSVYAHLLAIYMYPHLTGLPFRYEGTDIGPTVRLIRGLPARDVIPLGSFFFAQIERSAFVWSRVLSGKIEDENADNWEAANNAVPQLAKLATYATIRTVATHWRVTHEEVLLSRNDKVMRELVYLHHSARRNAIYQRLITPKTTTT